MKEMIAEKVEEIIVRLRKEERENVLNECFIDWVYLTAESPDSVIYAGLLADNVFVLINFDDNSVIVVEDRKAKELFRAVEALAEYLGYTVFPEEIEEFIKEYGEKVEVIQIYP